MQRNFPRPLAQRIATELRRYPPKVLSKLRYEWDLWALPHQVPPEGEWATWLNRGGRGSGKTTGASQYIRRAVNRGVKRINLIGRTAAAVRDDMVRGEAGVISVFPPDERPEYIASQSVVRFHTGAEALMLTAEEPKAIQGKNAEIAWLDEFSTYGQKAEEVWRQVCLSTRVGDPKKIITTNSLPSNEFLEKLLAEAPSTSGERRIVVTQSTSFDNFANLPDAFQAQVEELMQTAYGRAWVLGERLVVDGALWREDWFKYIPEAPAGGKVVIGVNPSGTEDGDETGIIVAKRVGDKGYILEDLSGHHDAETWPRLLVEAARKWRASIVIERNRGMNFLRALIKPLDRAIPLREVVARQRKIDRFLPIASLYEIGHKSGVGKIFHCGQLSRLERQMTSWAPTDDGKRHGPSPDRVDATVYALMELGFHLGLVRGPVTLNQDLSTPNY